MIGRFLSHVFDNDIPDLGNGKAYAAGIDIPKQHKKKEYEQYCKRKGISCLFFIHQPFVPFIVIGAYMSVHPAHPLL